MYPIKQSTAETITFFAHDANGDAVTGLTDGSFTKRISKNGAAFGAMTVTITEMENGWYSIPLSTSHSDTTGLLTVVFTNAGAKQVNLQWRVEANLTDDVASLVTTVDTVVDGIQTDLDNGTDGLGAIKAETALIVADTNELQTDDVPGLIAALNNIAAGDVWAVDATTQQTQGTFGQAIGDPALDTTTIYQAVATDAAGDNVSVDIAAVKAETALIVADTNELQTDDVPGLIGALNDIAAGDIWAVDATTQQTQGTFGQAIGDPVADTTTIYQAVATDASGDNVGVDTTAILADTADMQPKLGVPAADIAADIAAVKVDTAATLVDTGTTGVVIAAGGISSTTFAAGAIDAAATSADFIDEILDEAIGDGTLTMRETLRVLIAGMAGKLSGAATTTITIRNDADTANVIVATVDASGNRSAVTVTP